MFRNELKKQAKKLMLETNDEILEALENEAEQINEKLLLLEAIDTTGVKKFTRINDKPTSYLREDVAEQPLDQSVILSNAPVSEGDFVVISKEVKNV